MNFGQNKVEISLVLLYLQLETFVYSSARNVANIYISNKVMYCVRYVDWLVTTFNGDLPDESWRMPDPHLSATRRLLRRSLRLPNRKWAQGQAGRCN